MPARKRPLYPCQECGDEIEPDLRDLRTCRRCNELARPENLDTIETAQWCHIQARIFLAGLKNSDQEAIALEAAGFWADAAINELRKRRNVRSAEQPENEEWFSKLTGIVPKGSTSQ